MDFTINTYVKLLHSLKNAGYSFQTFEEFLVSPKERTVILRHDVDLLPENSLRFASIQHNLGIHGTYYFRVVPESWDEKIIIGIKEMGHEIGYHYETMDTSSISLKSQSSRHSAADLIDLAYDEFVKHLEVFKKLAPVKTICMHGSPKSKYDNKEIWKKHDYKALGIIGEPYFDVDFNKVFYITDTGRRWDGFKVSVRDRVQTSYKQTYHSTDDIIRAVMRKDLPDQVMFTFHPQRWHNEKIKWVKELVLQNLKNVVKQKFYVTTNVKKDYI